MLSRSLLQCKYLCLIQARPFLIFFFVALCDLCTSVFRILNYSSYKRYDLGETNPKSTLIDKVRIFFKHRGAEITERYKEKMPLNLFMRLESSRIQMILNLKTGSSFGDDPSESLQLPERFLNKKLVLRESQLL